MRTIHSIFIWSLTLPSIVLVVGCSHTSHSTAQEYDWVATFRRHSDATAPMENILALLRVCPSPLDHDLSDDAEILRVLASICTYDLDAIQMAERALVASKHSLHDDAKLYVLHRVLFEVPEYPSGADRRVFSGWEGAHDPKGYRMIWPLAKTANGELILTPMNTSYMGPSYQAVAEFEFFQQRFSVRKDAR